MTKNIALLFDGTWNDLTSLARDCTAAVRAQS